MINKSSSSNKPRSDGVCCLSCNFFERFDIQKKEDNVIGACKANPPIPAPDWAESKLGVWPVVLGSFWCGIFEPKIEVKAVSNGNTKK